MADKVIDEQVTEDERLKAAQAKACKEDKPKEEEVEKMEEVGEDEEETDEDKKKKKKSKLAAKKGDGSSQSPEEASTVATTGGSTTSPGATTPSKPQNVFVPQSSIIVSREQDTPMGKSAEPDLMKSPLYLGIVKQLDGISESMTKKLEAMEKSVNDRLTNTKKELEKFYNQSFYKAAGENVAPEATQRLSIAKQLEMGEIRFRNK